VRTLIRAIPVALLIGLLAGVPAATLAAETVRIAVASNFATLARQLATDFEADHPYRVVLSVGATGKHYAQIVNGAPFDVFLAADSARPERLEREGRSVPGSRFVYAVGELVAWAPRLPGLEFPAALLDDSADRIAIANPRLAPYGRAAQEVLQALGAWDALRPKIVRGENVGQALQFVHSGNADVGLVAHAQLRALDGSATGSHWVVPRHLYSPIEQQAVLLRDHAAPRAFLAYLRSDEARALIRAGGYRTP
jgi:molybdate transport system substrate-binding protein